MARRSGLGKGLGALIPGEEPEHSGRVIPAEARDAPGAVFRELPVRAITPNQYQPRDHFDDASLESLTASIRELGVLQPVLVRPLGSDRFELIAGERRWRAAQRAGLKTVPALVKETEEQASLEHALVENLHRSDLNPLEEAAAYQQLMEEFGLTQDAVAKRVGRSRSSVTNLLRLFQLPAKIQKQVALGKLSAGHGRALLALPDESQQLAMAAKVVAEDWSVRELEDRIRNELGRPKPEVAKAPARASAPAAPASALRPVALVELEELLSDHLDTRVSVAMAEKRGRVQIEFADLDDLERIYRVMIDGRPDRQP